jgi:hypothetical protein
VFCLVLDVFEAAVLASGRRLRTNAKAMSAMTIGRMTMGAMLLIAPAARTTPSTSRPRRVKQQRDFGGVGDDAGGRVGRGVCELEHPLSAGRPEQRVPGAGEHVELDQGQVARG